MTQNVPTDTSIIDCPRCGRDAQIDFASGGCDCPRRVATVAYAWQDQVADIRRSAYNGQGHAVATERRLCLAARATEQRARREVGR